MQYRYNNIHFYRGLIILALGGLSFFNLSFPPESVAGSSMAEKRSPGYYRMMLGDFEVTALYDGYTKLDRDLLHNASKDEIGTLLSGMFVNGQKMETSVNAYLINTGAALVLIDAGAGRIFGPTLGNVIRNMDESGYDSAQVDTVLITHMHGDHIGGLLNDEGKPVYPNATVYVSKEDNDFFFSKEAEEKMAPAKRSSFKTARDISAPYIAIGRWKTFDMGNMPVEGIKAVAAPGHTPGHTAFEIRSGDQSLLIWGDIVHSMAAQFPNPDVSIEFDVDQKLAVATRKALMKSVASGPIVAGMHMPFPGIGMVRSDGENRYSWVPINLFKMQ